MKEIRLHGLGGQGAVIASQILATALAKDGWQVAAFPQFGAERRGSRVAAFLRYDKQPIREKCLIYYPDALLVLDHKQIQSKDTYRGIKRGSLMVANSPLPISESFNPNLALVAWIDATKLSTEVLGRPIVNTCLVGAFAGASRWVRLESLVEALPEFFEGKMLEKNVYCLQRGYEEVETAKMDKTDFVSAEA